MSVTNEAVSLARLDTGTHFLLGNGFNQTILDKCRQSEKETE